MNSNEIEFPTIHCIVQNTESYLRIYVFLSLDEGGILSVVISGQLKYPPLSFSSNPNLNTGCSRKDAIL